MPKLSVHLVTWNGNKYYPYLFESLKKQTYQDWELFVWDNASKETEDLEKLSTTLSVPVTFVKNSENLGFAGGHNQIYAKTNSPFFVLLNQDLYVQPDCLEKLMGAIEQDEKIAVVSPRLMKWDFEHQKFTEIIDSLGLKVLRNRRVIEIGAGQSWQNNDEHKKSVFGVSGTMPLFRRSAIKTIEFSPTEFLDASYHSYKEDVDLAYRIRSAGFEACTILDAVAYHDRSAAGPRELSDLAAAENKRKQSTWIQYHSYKNHLMTLYKNEHWQNFLLDFPWVIWYELKKFLWLLVFRPGVLKGLGEAWKNRGDLKMKRLKINEGRNIHWSAVRTWWI